MRGFLISSAPGSCCHSFLVPASHSGTDGLQSVFLWPWLCCVLGHECFLRHLFNMLFHRQLLPITVVTSLPPEPSRAAGGARAVSEAIDRIGLLGSRYLSRRLQNKNMKTPTMQPWGSINWGFSLLFLCYAIPSKTAPLDCILPHPASSPEAQNQLDFSQANVSLFVQFSPTCINLQGCRRWWTCFQMAQGMGVGWEWPKAVSFEPSFSFFLC